MNTNFYLYPRLALRAMAWAMVLFAWLTLLPPAIANSQQSLSDVKLTLSLKEVPVKKVLDKIENETDFNFSFGNRRVNLDQKVTIQSNNKSLKEILYSIALQTDLNFKRISQNIVVMLRTGKMEIIAEVAEVTVSGIVKDMNGDPLPGVNVVIKGTSKGSITDINGAFTLTVPDDATLIFSYIGFNTEEISVNGRTNIDVALTPSLTSLENIVVIGYGTAKKKDVTGAISEVQNVEQLNTRPIFNAQDVMQGKVAGVTVLQNGGDPTAQPMVRVRGIGTLSNEEPLYVVDGVPGAPVPNPADIETMNVLKDASASSIYGVRAAAGVVIITTKKGQSGKTQVNFNTYYGVQNVSKKLDALNAQEYADVMNLAFNNAGYAADYPGREYIQPQTNAYGLVTRTNWMDEIFRTATIQNYDVSINGGSEKSRFYTSLGYKKSEGTLRNTYADRYTLRLNSDFDLGEHFKVGENFTVLFNNGNYGVNTTSGYTGALITAIYYPPSAVIWENEAEGLYGGVAPRGSDYIGSYGDLINPVAYLNRLNDKRPSTTLSGNVFAEYNIIEGLTYKFNLGINRTNTTIKSFTSKITEPGKIFDYNELYQEDNLRFSWVAENTLNYKKMVGDHSFDILLGYMSQKYEYSYFNMSAQGFPSEDPSQQYFPNANGPFAAPGGGSTENALVSALARLNYDYKDKYLLTATIRRDGSSKLSKDNRWGSFPSASVAWRLSNEDFMQDVSWLNDLKLRASWGKIGNLGALGDFPTTVSLSRTEGLLGNPASYTNYYGYAIDGIANSDIKWETTTQTDIGLNATALDSKIYLNADYFFKETSDMLVQVPLVGTAGVSNAPWENAGTVQNKGWEFLLGYTNQIGDLTFDISANLTTIKNEVTSLGSNYDNIQHSENVRGILQPLRTEVGHAIYSYYVYENDGIFQNDEEINNYIGPNGKKVQPYAQPGDLKFVDQNGDGKLNEEDKVFKGDNFPDFTYGINLSLNYKAFDLTMLLQGVSGIKVFNGLKFSTLKPTQGYNMLADVKDAWSPENTGSDIPRVSVDDQNNNFGTVSDWYLEDASYMRVKNVTLGYTLPTSFANRLKLSQLRIYATATNLLTFTDYSGFDPEVISNHGIDMGYYPQARSFIFGLNLKF
ncbi:TonB-dependent receptor [Fulvivirga maritima]|uniref:TonB-dependent receptor n=1 Tax=Fulvivirga maritima TaxID=2904247 RepID=UPI001F457026|nr:TonB-dependent receptor [Fulvivirga maritima]UII26752.1 TonB-dependent receptor [Fulvivirga maritima]